MLGDSQAVVLKRLNFRHLSPRDLLDCRKLEMI